MSLLSIRFIISPFFFNFSKKTVLMSEAWKEYLQGDREERTLGEAKQEVVEAGKLVNDVEGAAGKTGGSWETGFRRT